MKSLIVYIALLLLIPFTGCYTVLLTTENTYEEELTRLESEVETDESTYHLACIYRINDGDMWYEYYNIPWWYTSPMVSKDITPNRIDGGTFEPRRQPVGTGGGGGVSRTDNGGGNTTSGNISRDAEKKKVNADENNQNNNNSSDRNGGDKKNLRNEDGNRSTPKRR